MQQQDTGATSRLESARLDGKLVMLGCGSIGQAALPLPNEFVNTWSIDGFVDELMQPAELSLGTSEPQKPRGALFHRRGSGSIYLRRPGGATFARSWLPSLGGFQGLLMPHDAVFSIADHLSVRDGRSFAYRPTVLFVYHPCDDAMLSALELEGRGWQM